MDQIERLYFKVRDHDWESDHPRDLAERIDLLRDMGTMSLKELARVFSQINPRKIVFAMHQLEQFKIRR